MTFQHDSREGDHKFHDSHYYFISALFIVIPIYLKKHINVTKSAAKSFVSTSK